MADSQPPPPGSFAARLDQLFLNVHPGKKTAYSYAEVAAAINDKVGPKTISATYLWQLRTGKRDNPTLRHISALASFFGVSPLYFFDAPDKEQAGDDVALASAMADNSVRDVALSTMGLSERSLSAIQAMIDNARTLEGLPEERAR